ncbi:hypothetical protein ACOSQ2_010878 [Xanthoceras sorbifolium]
MDRNMSFSGVLAYELLLMEIWHDSPRDEKRFRLGQHIVQFSKVEFCLITRLKFDQISDTSAYADVLNDIHSKYFRKRTDVKVEDVKFLLKRRQYAIPHDALKLLLILMLQNFLYGSDDKTNIPVWVLQLVDDLETFDAFLWGSYIYSNSILSYMLA